MELSLDCESYFDECSFFKVDSLWQNQVIVGNMSIKAKLARVTRAELKLAIQAD